jgi:hypothetical protein
MIERSRYPLLVTWLACAMSACLTTPAALTQLLEARRFASEMHVAFTQTAEASNRAVMANDDATAQAAASEARERGAVVDSHLAALRSTLQALGYKNDLAQLESFESRFAEYRRLNDEVLSMVVENSNLKAQRLSFGPASEAADAFYEALEAATRNGAADNPCCARELAARAWASLLEIRVLYSRHIAEADDGEMTRMEALMTTSATAARDAVAELTKMLPAASAPLAAGRSALDRFLAVHAEIIQLSRRNSNVRALALSLGQKRMLTAEGEAELQALEAALAKHEFTATR